MFEDVPESSLNMAHKVKNITSPTEFFTECEDATLSKPGTYQGGLAKIPTKERAARVYNSLGVESTFLHASSDHKLHARLFLCKVE